MIWRRVNEKEIEKEKKERFFFIFFFEWREKEILENQRNGVTISYLEVVFD